MKRTKTMADTTAVNLLLQILFFIFQRRNPILIAFQAAESILGAQSFGTSRSATKFERESENEAASAATLKRAGTMAETAMVSTS